ncbi:HNH endonuclease [Serratia bockelmannii]|uniref:ABC-three component system protein n=1 Tax=Serratia bockelmannii TaxID=2703793 RepID=UPI002240262E|nr:ABC-three component system protein [Serratia bockelmannii]MCW7648802.1 HNH endonuclease [Serratia bockelmannii]MCW7658723.1 HNH endonuclease [Serratia bockelmannii]MCW7678371.1 HNH endonuclease [Serratia bockelmannii]MCW7683148.1 HNH endonuclease [Serratia bockelmannii]MCW7688061.1 HNH endonuclease [Serratia bockelmannii]
MAGKRGSITENMNIALCNEVNGICPKCNKALLKKSGKSHVKVYEVAHIYPHSPRPSEINFLKNEKRLTTDVDDLGNLIALCKDCHKVFDNPRTVEGYREMCKIKTVSSQNAEIRRNLSTFHLTEEVKELIEKLASKINKAQANLDFDAKTIDKKLPDDDDFLLRFKVQGFVNYFYVDIKQLFQELDKDIPGTSELVYSEVKTHYLSLKRSGLDKEKAFDALVSWVHLTCQKKNKVASEVLISFFVQNCEVF